MTSLAQALLSPDSDGPVFTGRVKQIYANGTVDVDLGAGRVATACTVLSTYTPATGDSVVLSRKSQASWIVWGSERTSNPTTVTVGHGIRTPFNVFPVASGGGTLTINPTATKSYRGADGWSGSFLPASDSVGQGAYSTSYGYYQGCYFYGVGAFSSISGRTCTGLTIRLHRASSGGVAGAQAQVLAPHANYTQPASDPPYWTRSSGNNVGSLSWSGIGTFSLPTDWGQDLIDGRSAGIGHFLLAAGNGNYSIALGISSDSASGQLALTWV